MKKLIISMMLVPLLACGQTDSKNTPDQQAVFAKAKQTFNKDGLEVISVESSVVAGLYEVVLKGNQIIYVDGDVNYMFYGDLIDIAQQKSLTEERMQKLTDIDFATLPFDKAIKDVKGNGQDKLVVFSDPDCPYCQRLEQVIAELDNITVYTFLMPIPSLHPDAYRKSVQIWCQKDKTKVWTDWMREKKAIPTVAECDNPVAQTMELAQTFGFNGTPAIVFANGKVQMGAADKANLEKLIKENR